MESNIEKFNLVVTALEKAKVSAHVGLSNEGVININLGMNYPNKEANKVFKVIDSFKLKSSEYSVQADSWSSEKYIESKNINGGKKNWDMIKAKKKAGKHPVTFLRSR